MMPPPQGFGAPPNVSGLKLVVVMVAFALAVYILGPPLYWQLAHGAAAARRPRSCAPCVCDCLSASESMLLPGFGSSDCEKGDPILKEDLDKNFAELLSEELQLQEKVAEESQLHADSALLDAKKLASQYQKEAEKCNFGMETCEEAREKSQAALTAQKKISIIWEKRAREMGWRDRSEQRSIFSRIGLSDIKSNGQADSSFFRRRTRKL